MTFATRTSERRADAARASTPARGLHARGARIRERLGTSVDGASLAVFRIGFGAIVAWEIWREYDSGAMRVDYVLPDFHYTWWLFGWVRPLPGAWMYLAFALVGICAVLFAVGLFYRATAFLVWGGLTYWFLIEKARYLNHHYLAILLAFLFIFVPGHAAYSIGRRKPWESHSGVPNWSVWLMRFQVGVPYFFAGIAKLNFDWLVRNQPLHSWLSERTDFPILGHYFVNDSFVRLLAWGSALLDLSVPLLLLHRRTRAPAYGLALAFHFMNSRLFGIGIFPWMMIVATTIFFEPEWPRRMGAALRWGHWTTRMVVVSAFGVGFVIGGFLPGSFAPVRALVGGFGVAFLVFHLLPEQVQARWVAPRARPASPWRGPVFTRRLVTLLVVWVVVQLLVPLRHFAIPGNVNWTDEGSQFAWRMLLIHREFHLAFRVTDGVSGTTWVEDLSRHVSPYQLSKTKSADMILELAHRIADFYRARGRQYVVVEVEAFGEINERPQQRFIDPTVDLARIRRPHLPPTDWVLPLKSYR